MLIEYYDLLVITPPCNPGAEFYIGKARLVVDISQALPYLNATLDRAVYYPDAQALTWEKGRHKIAFHAYEIGINNAEDRGVAEWEIRELVELVNQVWERRATIIPEITNRKKLTPLAIYQLLPRTNCQQCGETTCYTFALKLVAAERSLLDCPHLSKQGLPKGIRAQRR